MPTGPDFVVAVKPMIWMTAHEFNKQYNPKWPGMETRERNENEIFKFSAMMFNNNDKTASLEMSDHRPVWPVFNYEINDD